MKPKRDTSHLNRKLDDHKALSFELEKNRQTWEGNTLEVKSDPLIDAGVGKPYILRCFEFRINPLVKQTPTRQELFNHHWRQIQSMLWADGLKAYEAVNPRIIVGKQSYRIFVTAEPRLSNGIAISLGEKPRTLQQIIKQ